VPAVCHAGRADYFGPVLNRAARVHSASQGGQVLAEAFATYKAVKEWQQSCSQAGTAGCTIATSVETGILHQLTIRSWSPEVTSAVTSAA
jgi:class 3 adenylate cyclase